MLAISRKSFISEAGSEEQQTHVNDIGTKPVTVVEIDKDGNEREITTRELCVDKDQSAAVNVVDSVLNTQRGELQFDSDRGIPYLETIFSNPNRRLEWETEMREAIERMPFVDELTDFTSRMTDDGTFKNSRKKIVYDARIRTKFSEVPAELSDSRTITLKTFPVEPHKTWELQEDSDGTRFTALVAPGRNLMISVVCEKGTSIRWNHLNGQSATFVGTEDIICTHRYTSEEFSLIADALHVREGRIERYFYLEGEEYVDNEGRVCRRDPIDGRYYIFVKSSGRRETINGLELLYDDTVGKYYYVSGGKSTYYTNEVSKESQTVRELQPDAKYIEVEEGSGDAKRVVGYYFYSIGADYKDSRGRILYRKESDGKYYIKSGSSETPYTGRIDPYYYVNICLGRGIVNFHIIGGNDMVTAVTHWAKTVKDASFAFRNCANLVETCDWTEIVENVASCYEGCTSLKGVRFVNDADNDIYKFELDAGEPESAYDYRMPVFTESITGCSRTYKDCINLNHPFWKDGLKKGQPVFGSSDYMPAWIDANGTFEDCYLGANEAIRALVTQMWGGEIVDLEDGVGIYQVRYCTTLSAKGSITISGHAALKTEVWVGTLTSAGSNVVNGREIVGTVQSDGKTVRDIEGTANIGTVQDDGTATDADGVVIGTVNGFLHFKKDSATPAATFPAGDFSGKAISVSGNKVVRISMGVDALTFTAGGTNVTEVRSYGIKLTDLTNLFKGCTSLTLACRFHDAAKVATSCYEGCSNLATVEGLYSAKNFWKFIEKIDNCFSGCAKLTKPANAESNNIAEFSSRYNHLDGCFKGCAKLTGKVPRFLNAHLTAVSCFEGCAELGADTENELIYGDEIQDLTNCFKGCSKLVVKTESVPDFPLSVKAAVSCFEGCTSLTAKIIDLKNVAHGIDVSRCFYGCGKVVNNGYIYDCDIMPETVSAAADYVGGGCDRQLKLLFAESWGGLRPDATFDEYVSAAPDSKYAGSFKNHYCDFFIDTRDASGEVQNTFSFALTVKDATYGQSGQRNINAFLIYGIDAYPRIIDLTKKVKPDGAASEPSQNGDTFTVSDYTSSDGIVSCIVTFDCSQMAQVSSMHVGIVDIASGNRTLTDNFGLGYVTRIKVVDDQMRNCLTNFNTWSNYIEDAKDAFKNCLGLIQMPDAVGTGVTTLESCFEGCINLEGRTDSEEPLADWSKCPNCTSIKACYKNCTSLVGVQIPELPPNATDASECFWGCTNLVANDGIFRYWNKVKNCNWCFYNCTSLTGSLIPDNGDKLPLWDYVETAEGCYYGCAALTGLIPTWDSKSDKWTAPAPRNKFFLTLIHLDACNLTNVKCCYYGCASLQIVSGLRNFELAMPDNLGSFDDDDEFNAAQTRPEDYRYHNDCVTGCSADVRKSFFGTWGGTFRFSIANIVMDSGKKKGGGTVDLCILTGYNDDNITKVDWGDGSESSKEGVGSIEVTAEDTLSDTAHPYTYDGARWHYTNAAGADLSKGVNETDVKGRVCCVEFSHEYNKKTTCTYTIGLVNCEAVAAIEFGPRYVIEFKDDEKGQLSALGGAIFKGQTKMTSASSKIMEDIGPDCFSGCKKLVTVDFPSLSNVGDRAFYRCSKLTDIALGDIKHFGEKVLYGCTNLQNITIEELSEICAKCFDGMRHIRSISIGCVTSIGDCAFRRVGSSEYRKNEVTLNLTSVPYYDIKKTVRQVRYNNLNEQISNTVKSEVTRTLQPGPYERNGVTYIKFDGVEYATSFTLASDAYDIAADGSYSKDLTNVTYVENADQVGMMLHGNPFSNAYFTSIKADEINFEGRGSKAFQNCKALKVFSVESMNMIPDKGFYNVRTLEDIEIGRIRGLDGVSGGSIGSRAFYHAGLSKMKNDNDSISITIGDEDDASSPATTIYERAFSQSYFRNITLGKVTFSGDRHFYNCSKLERIRILFAGAIPNQCFKGLKNVLSLTISNVTSIGNNAFEQLGATSYKNGDIEVVIEGVGTDPVTLGSNCFRNAYISHLTISKVNGIGSNVFKGCKYLTSLEMSVTGTIAEYAFNGVKSLESIELGTDISAERRAFGKIGNKDSEIVMELGNVTRVDGKGGKFQLFLNSFISRITINNSSPAGLYGILDGIKCTSAFQPTVVFPNMTFISNVSCNKYDEGDDAVAYVGGGIDGLYTIRELMGVKNSKRASKASKVKTTTSTSEKAIVVNVYPNPSSCRAAKKYQYLSIIDSSGTESNAWALCYAWAETSPDSDVALATTTIRLYDKEQLGNDSDYGEITIDDDEKIEFQGPLVYSEAPIRTDADGNQVYSVTRATNNEMATEFANNGVAFYRWEDEYGKVVKKLEDGSNTSIFAEYSVAKTKKITWTKNGFDLVEGQATKYVVGATLVILRPADQYATSKVYRCDSINVWYGSEAKTNISFGGNASISYNTDRTKSSKTLHVEFVQTDITPSVTWELNGFSLKSTQGTTYVPGKSFSVKKPDKKSVTEGETTKEVECGSFTVFYNGVDSGTTDFGSSTSKSITTANTFDMKIRFNDAT